MKYPSRAQWAKYFRGIPLWVVVVIVILLYGRLVLIAVWHWLSA